MPNEMPRQMSWGACEQALGQAGNWGEGKAKIPVGDRSSLRTADVSSRSSPLRDVLRGVAKRPSAAMSEEKRLPFAGYDRSAVDLFVPQAAQARNMSIGEHRHCCETFKILGFVWEKNL